jgi:FkbM family methyltransferase
MTRDEVNWAYRYVLGREPTRDEIARLAPQAMYWSQLRAILLGSDEFAAEQKVIGHTAKWVVTEIFSGALRLWIDLADKYVSFGCLIDDYEPLETAALRRLLRPGAHVVDVGANVGWFTFLAALAVGPEGHVSAIEPRRPTVDYLRRSVGLNQLDERVTVMQTAVGRETGSASIVWHPASRNPGSAHFGEPGDNLPGDDLPGDKLEVQAVDVRTLDDLLAGTAVDCVKLDIEGAEGLALLGADRVLRESRPLILCEINPAGLQNVSDMSVDAFLMLIRSRSYAVFSLAGRDRLVRTDGGIDLHGQEVVNVILAHEERLPDQGS